MNNIAASALGLDFGTSNSTAGWWRPDTTPMLVLEEDKPTLPSVVFFNADEDSTHYGRDALNQYLEGYEGRLMRSLKSLLGTRLLDGHTEVQGRLLPYRDLLAKFIGELKSRAEKSAGRAFDSVVLGRPVHFIDDDSQADAEAENTLADIARRAGFREISFQFEPIAAAFAYEATIEREELVLIADIGGGTSDFSLLRLSPDRRHSLDRRQDILANSGVHVGGTDFDKALNLAGVMPLLGYRTRLKNNAEVPSGYYLNLATWHTINQVYARRTWAELQDVYRDALERDKVNRLMTLVEHRHGHWLAMEMEAAKIRLSDLAATPVDLGVLESGLRLDLDRSLFDEAAEPLVQSVELAIADLLQAAGVRPEQVDTLFMTGGGSGVPLLRQRIAASVPSARLAEGDRFGSIGAGLAIEAQRRYG